MEALSPLNWEGLLGWGLLLGRSTVVGGYLEASQRLPGGTSEASRRLPRGYLSWGDPPSSEAKQPPNFRGDNLGGNLKATRTLLYGGLLSWEVPEKGGLRTLKMYGYVYEGVSPRRPRANGNEKTSYLRGRSLRGVIYKFIENKYY